MDYNYLNNLIANVLAGKQLQRLSFDHDNNGIWIDTTYLHINQNMNVDHYRVKTEPTREEITAKWVKDNEVKVGDTVKVISDKPFMCKGSLYEVKGIQSYCITCKGYAEEIAFNVEDIAKATKKIVPFTFEDADLFRGKWIKDKIWIHERQIIGIRDNGIVTINHEMKCCYHTFELALEELVMIDGTPFGKEIWE